MRWVRLHDLLADDLYLFVVGYRVGFLAILKALLEPRLDVDHSDQPRERVRSELELDLTLLDNRAYIGRLS